MPWKTSDVERFKKGLTDPQKRQWIRIANSSLERCLSQGGKKDSCEASAIRQASGTVGDNMDTLSFVANTYEIRRETHQGKEHIVIPVIMLKDGVHNGSRGPLLHLAEEYGKVAAAWNGIPVTVHHPSDDNGNLIPANSPSVIDTWTVGRIYNTYVDNGLRSEAWIDEQKCLELAPDILDYIQNRRPLDVSVGVFSDEEDAPGNWNGETYAAIARNHRPDHLALLPGEHGACSWNDGCGIRANKAKGGEELKDEIIANAQGFKEICDQIQRKLYSMDSDTKVYFLEEVFADNTFIFEVRGGSDQGFFKRGYQVDADNRVEFTGDPIKVVVSKEYTPVAVNSQTKGGLNAMSKKECKACPEQVKLIIQSEHTRFEEGDREWLEGLEEGQLLKLLPIEPVVEDKTPQVNKAQAIEVLKENFKTAEQFLELLPAGIKESVSHGLSLYNAERKELADKIVANSDFEAADLEKKSIVELKKLSSLIKSTADFSGLGSGSKKTEEVTPMVYPAGVN